MYMSEFCCYDLLKFDGDHQRFTHETQKNSDETWKNSEHAIGRVETETVVHYESQPQSL